MKIEKIKQIVRNNETDKLYKRYKKSFDLVDEWNEKLTSGDLLTEYELSYCMDKMTGIYGNLSIVGEGIDAVKTNRELSFIENEFSKDGKTSVSKTEKLARASTKNLREYRADFLNYANAASKTIGTCQSRLKRLTVEKGAKGVDYTGETPVNSNKTNRDW